ncbi:CoA transferase [[Mycobacterium] burgundiense]|uniref:CoA transferase n=1 Tax=[Mycobacterium] burgundiense TaxID=3064286 RepID=A0ABM9M455_9MYCO|nr:CoA transferase [Mycolicibacterium sp. MU0053]CAJ1509942.1 CoA transferase [Mycolicibacterium sp. MU0053]
MGVLVIADDVLHRARQRVDDAEVLLTGRAALLGLTSRGRISAGGATQLLRARDGWCALTLSRDDDIACVPALLETDTAGEDPWPQLHRWADGRNAEQVRDRARLLDLPVAVLGEADPGAPAVQRVGVPGTPGDPAGLLVVDLTSMWAGPLCAQLLARADAVVVKVESPRRPDGTRAGDRRFFDWMNGAKLGYAADFDRDRSALRAMLSAADIVLEGSRPTALTRRGLGPRDVPARPGRVWARISGHGDDGDNSGRVAFGDDAAVAGGLVCRDETGPVFMGDALADPLTGIEAYVAVLDSLRRGGGELIEVSMAGVAAGYAVGATAQSAVSPRAPEILLPAPELGADNGAVDHLVSQRLGATC